MHGVEKAESPKDVWVMCPACEGLFYIHRLFYETKYNHLKLHCPFCHKEFSKEDTKTWGA